MFYNKTIKCFYNLNLWILNRFIYFKQRTRYWWVRYNQIGPLREGRRGCTCYIRKFLSYNHKISFCSDIESIFVNIFLPKSKPILVGSYIDDLTNLIEHFNNYLKEGNISNTQERYLIGEFNVNMLNGNKILLKKQYSDSCSQTSLNI